MVKADLTRPLQHVGPSPSDSQPSSLPGPLRVAQHNANGVRSQGHVLRENVKNWRKILQTWTILGPQVPREDQASVHENQKREEGLGESHKEELTDKRKNTNERGNKLHVDVALCAGVFKIHKTFLELQGQ